MGGGGIAKFNYDLMASLLSNQAVKNLTVWARDRINPVPFDRVKNIRFEFSYFGGAIGYVSTLFFRALKNLFNGRRYEIVYCCHINFLPAAYLINTILGSRIVLFIHGIEAWKKKGYLQKFLLRKVTHVISVSQFTRDKFIGWSGFESQKISILPNSINMDICSLSERNPELEKRYGLSGKFVVMTLCRHSAGERYKGVDEILELLPDISDVIPNVVYLIAGDGDDLDRLKEKVAEMGVSDRVVFAGYIPENMKLQFYGLADVFSMAGYGEGFGIVFLEAMACGIPVIASCRDGSKEAVLGGELGAVADPMHPQTIKEEIIKIYRNPVKKVPDNLGHFSFENFKIRLNDILGRIA